MENVPILWVQYQRGLPNHQHVVSGPTYGGSLFHWTSGNTFEVKFHDPISNIGSVSANLSSGGEAFLSSSELFGYDSFASECPVFRRLQNFNSAMLVFQGESNVIGRIMLPASMIVRFVCCKLRLSLSDWETEFPGVLSEIDRSQNHDRLIFRWKGESSDGFALLPAACLCNGPSSVCDATLILPANAAEHTSGNLYISMSMRSKRSRRVEHREVHVGAFEVFGCFSKLSSEAANG
jgi:hypothetical protein